jgi:hypothetical protein
LLRLRTHLPAARGRETELSVSTSSPPELWDGARLRRLSGSAALLTQLRITHRAVARDTRFGRTRGTSALDRSAARLDVSPRRLPRHSWFLDERSREAPRPRASHPGSLPRMTACVPDRLPTIHGIAVSVVPRDGVSQSMSRLLLMSLHRAASSRVASPAMALLGFLANAGLGPCTSRSRALAARGPSSAPIEWRWWQRARRSGRSISRRPACAPFQSVAPRDGSVPVARPMPSCGRRYGAPAPRPPPLQGLVPRPEFRPTWRVGRLLS